MASENLHSRRADAVAEIARAYAHRRQRHMAHTGHTVHRLLDAVGALLGRTVTAEPTINDMLLAELKALAAAVKPFAHQTEHVEGLGAPFHAARRAIAKAEGRCSHFEHLPCELAEASD